MSGAEAWLAAHGLGLPDRAAAIEAAVAGGFILLALALGVLAGRRLGPRLAEAWAERVQQRTPALAPRIAETLRHAVAALILAIVAAARPWDEIAAILLGIALGAAAARMAHQLLRAIGVARWMSWTVATIVFVALVSRAVGGLEPITALLDRIGMDIGRRRLSLLSLLYLLVTAVVLYALVRLANRVIGHSLGRARGLDATQRLLAQKLAAIAVVVAAFFLGIDLLGIDLTAFAVFSGAFGLAIGFGLQKTIGNLIAGIILLMDRSIKPGDVIVVGQRDVGWVNKIGVRAVSVVTRDGKEHLIPNEILMTQEVENWSYTDRNVRVRIKVGVAYDCDLPLAQSLMLRAATESPRVLSSPKPNVWLTGFGEYMVEHEILAWISDPESGLGNVRSDVLNRLWRLFRDHGVGIPYPQREVHMRPHAGHAPNLSVAPAQPSDGK